ncbi:hypothetical protein ACIQAS_14855 [Bacillus safensis]
MNRISAIKTTIKVSFIRHLFGVIHGVFSIHVQTNQRTACSIT